MRDGSVRSARLDEIVAVDDYGVAAFDDAKIGLILQASAILESEIGHFGEDGLRDRHDDVVPAVLRTSTRTHVRLKNYVSIELSTLRFLETELLTRELVIE